MCGIAGAWGAIDGAGVTGEMLEVLRHRGPDARGVHAAAAGAIGCARLAIVDVAGGDQPLYNAGGSTAVVANGEIYNHLSLKEALGNTYQFTSGSDTEAIIALYEAYGVEAASRLNGIFAFAIADGSNLVLGRDPLGVKPLYMGSHTNAGEQNELVFASELKALLGRASEVRPLPPGCTFTPQEGVQRYYSVPEGWIGDRPTRRPMYADIRSKLESAVQSQLMGDGPVGVFLSGGLDSSLVAAMARPHIGELHTFAVGIEGSADLIAARQCARHIQSRHHERIITPLEIAEKLPEIIWRLESYSSPLVRAAIPNYFCAELASNHVKAVLTGEGADELFAGYGYHMDYRNPSILHRELHRSVQELHRTNLQRADRMSMAHSVEARVPFLDTGVVQCAMDISPQLKIVRPKPWSRRVGKWVLRQSFSGLLPDPLLWRPKETFNRGSGVDAAMPAILASFAGKQSLPEYRAANPKDRIADAEEMVFHQLLFSACGGARVLLDNVYHWKPDVLKERHSAAAKLARKLAPAYNRRGHS